MIYYARRQNWQPGVLVTRPDPAFWRNQNVFVTGHTGFKGGWLALWLAHMGARVTGYALEPENSQGIFGAANVAERITSIIGDIRDVTRLRQSMANAQPDVVFHLAAQALVRRAHRDPVETYDTNVVGTAKVLEEARRIENVRAAVVVTSDKVYENRDEGRPFREEDPLGGLEPYGVSKANAEMVVKAFRHGLGDNHLLAVATVRAGNVIGGGDWAEDRLIPDAIRAFINGHPLAVRNPASTRPWQHVFDPLAGYMLLAEKLLQESDLGWRNAWNFGPADTRGAPVQEVVGHLVGHWNAGTKAAGAAWHTQEEVTAPYEARVLGVDSAKARTALAWRPRLELGDAIAATAAWYKDQQQGADMYARSIGDIENYLARA
jgi:CDP-glucose 4,6-dehydratase